MLESKRSRVIFAVVVLLLGLPYVYFETRRRERVQLAWVVEDAGKAYIVAVDRKTGDEDYLMLETFAVDGGERVGRTEVGGTREYNGVAITGPVERRKAVLRYGKSVERFDLIDHTSEAASGEHSDNLYDGCRDGQRAAKGLNNPDLRGCQDGVGFVQHSTSSARQDWQASLVDADGTRRWTVSAAALTGDAYAWFGHGILVGEAWWVVVVVPARYNDGLMFLELDAQTGKPRRTVEL